MYGVPLISAAWRGVREGVRYAPDVRPFLSFQVHAYIISSLKKEMPNVFGKESKKKELVNNLGEIYQKIEREHQISPGDFPSLRKMQVWPPRAPRTYPLWALPCQGVRRWRGEAGGGGRRGSGSGGHAASWGGASPNGNS